MSQQYCFPSFFLSRIVRPPRAYAANVVGVVHADKSGLPVNGHPLGGATLPGDGSVQPVQPQKRAAGRDWTRLIPLESVECSERFLWLHNDDTTR